MTTTYPTKKPPAWIYVEGADRNEDWRRSHVYTGPSYHKLVGPLCGYGWNRSDGEAFSIFRGNGGGRGTCLTCEKRAAEGAGPVRPWAHKTRWI